MLSTAGGVVPKWQEMFMFHRSIKMIIYMTNITLWDSFILKFIET